MDKRTGIIVFGHVRPEPLGNVLESLKRQGALGRTSVWLDGDHGRSVWKEGAARCRDVADGFPEARVVAHRGHLGIEKLMLDGLSVMSGECERLIVLEDDCFPTRGAVETFERELEGIESRDDVYSVYGHHFLTPSEGETITRFQGWGWATTREKLLPILSELKRCFLMAEHEYLDWVRGQLTANVRGRLDVTPGRDVIRVLDQFFSWDSCTALLTAMRGMCHKKTPLRTIYNCGMGPGSGHFELNDHFRKPPLNMIAPQEVWDHFEQPVLAVGAG